MIPLPFKNVAISLYFSGKSKHKFADEFPSVDMKYNFTKPVFAPSEVEKPILDDKKPLKKLKRLK